MFCACESVHIGNAARFVRYMLSHCMCNVYTVDTEIAINLNQAARMRRELH